MNNQAVQALSYVQFRKKKIIITGDLVAALGITSDQERNLFSRLKTKGTIVRLKRGAYLFPLRLPPNGRFNVSELMVLSELMTLEKADYQISGPFAFQHEGFDEQIANQLHVYNNRLSGQKTIRGYRFIFIKTSKSRLSCSTKITTPEGAFVFIASKPKIIVDAFYDWSIFNTIPKAFGWLVRECKESPKLRIKVLKTALACANRSTIQRMGCLLEQNGIKSACLLAFQKYLGKTKSIIPLVPFKPNRGAIDKKWGVIINDNIIY